MSRLIRRRGKLAQGLILPGCVLGAAARGGGGGGARAKLRWVESRRLCQARQRPGSSQFLT